MTPMNLIKISPNRSGFRLETPRFQLQRLARDFGTIQEELYPV